MWYGLTREEAMERCRQQGLQASFILTGDPMAAAALPDAPAVLKVIRAKQKDGALIFLLGSFAEEKRQQPC